MIATADYRRCQDLETIRLCEATSHDGDPRTTLADCPRCGLPFWLTRQRRGGSPRVYCSPRCRWLAYWYRRQAAPAA